MVCKNNKNSEYWEFYLIIVWLQFSSLWYLNHCQSYEIILYKKHFNVRNLGLRSTEASITAPCSVKA